MRVFDPCGACWLTLTLFFSFPLFLLLLFLSLSLFFISLPFSQLFHSSIFFLSFFSNAESEPSLVWNDLLQGAYRSPPHLDFCVSQHQEPSACVMSVSPTDCVQSPSVYLVQFSYSRTSHALRCFNLNLKMVSDQNIPEGEYILSRQHVLTFIILVERIFLKKNYGLSLGNACLWLQARPWVFSYCSHDW